MADIQDAGRRDVLLALLLGVVSIAAYLIYPVLNHGPGKIFLRRNGRALTLWKPDWSWPMQHVVRSTGSAP